MQIFVAFICALACLLAASNAETITKHRFEEALKECVEEAKKEPTVIHSDGKELEGAKDEKKCANACALKKLKMLNEDGTFNKESTIADLPEGVSHDEAVKFIEICSTEKGDDPCSTADLLIACLTTDKVDIKVPWKDQLDAETIHPL